MRGKKNLRSPEVMMTMNALVTSDVLSQKAGDIDIVDWLSKMVAVCQSVDEGMIDVFYDDNDGTVKFLPANLNSLWLMEGE